MSIYSGFPQLEQLARELRIRDGNDSPTAMQREIERRVHPDAVRASSICIEWFHWCLKGDA